MRRNLSPWRVGALALSIGLGVSYVWYRAAQAEDQRWRVFSGSKSGRVEVNPPATAPTTTAAATPFAADEGVMLPSSKSFAVFKPATTTTPATQPLTIIYGSKSAPVDLSGVVPIPGAARPAATSQATIKASQ